MKKIKLISAGLFLLLSFFIGRKYFSFKKEYKNIVFVENSSLGKYVELFLLKNQRVAEDMNEILYFVKTIDVNLFQKLEKINLKYVKLNEHSFSIYLNGFDGKDDKLDVIYDVNEIGFFDSLFIQGDIELNVFFKFKRKTNTLYKVEKDSLLDLGLFDIIKIYQKQLGCEKIVDKSLSYKEIFELEIQIYDGEMSFNESEFSKETLQIFKDELKKEKYSFNKDETYIMTLRESNIDVYKCQ